MIDNTLVAGFLPITIEGLDNVKLQNRVDSKYVFHIGRLAEVLAQLTADYYVLEIDGNSLFKYESTYFDTPNYQLYTNHHNGKPNRLKIRTRTYVETGDVFFEIKKKVKGYRTDKLRVQLFEGNSGLNGAEHKLMDELHLQPEGLEEKIKINYQRITLVGINTDERVTLDLGLEFIPGGAKLSFPNLVIAEIKQDKASYLSPFAAILRSFHIPKAKISKYALAIALTAPEVKKNAFKSTINKVNKILNTQYGNS